MLQFKILILILLLVISPMTWSRSEKVGAGIVLGSYAGLSGVYKYNNKDIFDASLAFSLSNNRKLLIHAGKLFVKPQSLKMIGQVYDWYFGLGGRHIMLDRDNHDDDYRIGPRGSIGLKYNFSTVPIELIAEAALIFNILPSTSGDLDILIGGRYYF